MTYNTAREATGGAAPQGRLAFDSDGRLTGIGDMTYTYDEDDYVTMITGASGDGSIDYAYGGNPVPTSITWTGPVAGTVTIVRNALFQATSMGVGTHTADLSPDADGVQMLAGEMILERDGATFLKSTALDSVTDEYARNQFGEPTFYEAKYDDGSGPSGTLFSESYSRDKGGRIKRKDVRVVDPGTGTMESYTARYEYYPTGQLHLVQYNDQPVIEYTYDTNNNLIGEPATPSGAVFEGPSRLYLPANAATATPVAFEGTWQSTANHEAAEMAFEPDAALTETAVSAASCAADEQTLVNVFASLPLGASRTVGADEQIRMVLPGRRGEPDDDVAPVASRGTSRSTARGLSSHRPGRRVRVIRCRRSHRGGWRVSRSRRERTRWRERSSPSPTEPRGTTATRTTRTEHPPREAIDLLVDAHRAR